ncbi:MAG: hypothetical protein NT001_04615 [Candidatus Woesearchaeota archaeon]|nr:hypothetical protein [Candidatus Woesearchaeota archaeon]
MGIETIARSEFLNLHLNRFIEDMTLNESLSKYKGFEKLGRQNPDLQQFLMFLSFLPPFTPVGAFLGCREMFKELNPNSEFNKKSSRMVCNMAINSYGDRIYRCDAFDELAYKLNYPATAKFIIEPYINYCIKKGDYEGALMNLYLYNRGFNMSTRDERLRFASILFMAGRPEDAYHVLRGQVLNYDNLSETEPYEYLSGIKGVLAPDDNSKKIIRLFSQDFRSVSFDRQGFLISLDEMMPDPGSLDSRIYRAIINDTLSDSCSPEWTGIISQIMSENPKNVPATAKVIKYDGKLFKEQVILKIGEKDQLEKELKRTNALEKILSEYRNQNNPENFLKGLFVASHSSYPSNLALKTYKPVGIFDVEGNSVYAMLIAPGSRLLSVGEVTRANLKHALPFLIRYISLMHNNLPAELADPKITPEEIYSNISGTQPISSILRDKGASPGLIDRMQEKLQEFMRYSADRIMLHPTSFYIDSYPENWIYNQFEGLVRVDNSTLRIAPPQLDLAQILDYSNFMTHGEQKPYLRQYLKLNKGKFNKKEFYEVYDHACFYRGLRSIIIAKRYIDAGGDPARYWHHTVNCFYKSILALHSINAVENGRFSDLERSMFQVYHPIHEGPARKIRNILMRQR